MKLICLSCCFYLQIARHDFILDRNVINKLKEFFQMEKDTDTYDMLKELHDFPPG